MVLIYFDMFHDLLIPAYTVELGGFMWMVSNQGTSETHFFGLKSSVNLTPDCQNQYCKILLISVFLGLYRRGNQVGTCKGNILDVGKSLDWSKAKKKDKNRRGGEEDSRILLTINIENVVIDK